MPDLVKPRTRRARKPQWCNACQSHTIRPGDMYQRDVYTHDGRIYDWPLCLPCKDISQHVFDWWIHPEDGIDADAYQEWACEHRGDPEVGEAARAYLKRTGSEIPEEPSDV